MIRGKYRRIKWDLFVVQVSFDSLKTRFWAVIYRVPLESVLMCFLSGWVMLRLLSSGMTWVVLGQRTRKLVRCCLKDICRWLETPFLHPNGHNDLIRKFVERVLWFVNLRLLFISNYRILENRKSCLVTFILKNKWKTFGLFSLLS